jgi:CRISPR-associated protein Cmr1
MRALQVQLETVTPLFLGGADARGAPELRPASFKGALRFWWRALWGGVHPKRFDKLAEKEEQVFGSTNRASAVILRLASETPHAESWTFGNMSGVDYLFFSLQGRRKEPDRQGFTAGQRFRLTLQIRPGADQAEQAYRQSCAALWLLVHLGGMGARSRRGAGNLRVVRIDDGWPDEFPPLPVHTRSAENFSREISGGLGRLYDALNWPKPSNHLAALPEYDLLHPQSGPIYVLDKEWSSWQAALDEIGTAYRTFRSRRRPDYDSVKEVVAGRKSKMPPVERAAFGLPIVFYYRSLGDQRGTLEGEEASRRASPLFFHVSCLANGKYVVSFVHFQAQLLPKGTGLKLKPRGRPVFAKSPGSKPILDFLRAIGESGHKDKQGDLFIAPLWQVVYPTEETE